MPLNRPKSPTRRRLAMQLGCEQNWRCCYCGTALEPETLTIDHVEPFSLGGSNQWENLVGACGPCNTARGTTPAVMFYVWWTERRTDMAEQSRSLQQAFGRAKGPTVMSLAFKRAGL